MSFQAMALALNDPRAKKTSQHILLLLANYADENFECFPSVGHLAEVMGVSTNTVRSGINDLVLNGVIKVIRQQRNGRDMSNRYRLTLRGSKIEPPRLESVADTGLQKGEGAKIEPLPLRGSKIEGMGSKTEPSGGSKIAPMGSKTEPYTINEPISIDPINDTRVNRSALDEFLAYRKEIKKPLKDISIRSLVRKLVLLSHAQQAELIDLTISNGWQGIQFDRVSRSTTPHQASGSRQTREVPVLDMVTDRSWAE